MTLETARLLLSFHSGQNLHVDDPRWINGFLGMLRPYQGLREEAFHEVMECITALASDLAADRLERESISALWSICHLGRAWGLEAEGMLRRNGLINPRDIERLSDWIDCISYCMLCLLDGAGLEEGLQPYRSLRART